MEEGVLNSVDFNISSIPKSTHLFFDDDDGNITDVQDAANQLNHAMMSVWCPPSTVELHDATGIKTFACDNVEDIKTYNKLKFNDVVKDTDKLKILPIGAGITPRIIQQIIADETSPEKPTRLYFFDFDKLLSQFNGLTFPEDVDEQWLNDYSKCIFSDHIGVGDSVADDRLILLKRMFEMIGHERAYIITANGYASATKVDSGRMIQNPDLQTFIRLLQVLLPTFDPTHLKCTAGKKKSNDIGRIIDDMNKKYQGGSRHQRTKRTKRTKRTQRNQMQNPVDDTTHS